MTNIYNKIYHVENGTLVGNWYEEQCLRDKTNEGRTIIAQHVPKKFFSLDNKYNPETKINDTFKRTIGEMPYKEFDTTYASYGDFEKYKVDRRLPTKDKIYFNFFNCYSSGDNGNGSKQ